MNWINIINMIINIIIMLINTLQCKILQDTFRLFEDLNWNLLNFCFRNVNFVSQFIWFIFLIPCQFTDKKA